MREAIRTRGIQGDNCSFDSTEVVISGGVAALTDVHDLFPCMSEEYVFGNFYFIFLQRQYD